MAGRTFLREWRKYHHLTQDQVIERLVAMDDPLLPTTGASLSRLETGKQPYSERILEALATIYACEPWELLGSNPAQEGGAQSLFNQVYRDMNAQQRIQAIAILEVLRATG